MRRGIFFYELPAVVVHIVAGDPHDASSTDEGNRHRFQQLTF